MNFGAERAAGATDRALAARANVAGDDNGGPA
jgi:hypothetical protein